MGDIDTPGNQIFDGLPEPTSDWKAWFEGGTQQERVFRLMEGDPLHMAPRVHVWISTFGYFLSPEAVFQRGLTRLAMSFDGLPSDVRFNEWCVESLRVATQELIEEEAEEERNLVPNSDSEHGEFYIAVARLLSVDGAVGRLVCHTLNGLSRRERQAVATIGFAKLPLEQFAVLEQCTLDEAKKAFESAMMQVLLAVADREGTDLGPFGIDGGSNRGKPSVN